MESTIKQKRYIAVQGMNLDNLKGKPRVEPGDPLPEGLEPKDIKILLELGAIKEA